MAIQKRHNTIEAALFAPNTKLNGNNCVRVESNIIKLFLFQDSLDKPFKDVLDSDINLS